MCSAAVTAPYEQLSLIPEGLLRNHAVSCPKVANMYTLITMRLNSKQTGRIVLAELRCKYKDIDGSILCETLCLPHYGHSEFG